MTPEELAALHAAKRYVQPELEEHHLTFGPDDESHVFMVERPGMARFAFVSVALEDQHGRFVSGEFMVEETPDGWKEYGVMIPPDQYTAFKLYVQRRRDEFEGGE